MIRTREERTAARHYQRARHYTVPGDFDGDEWDLAVAWFGGKCLACGAPVVTVDHVVPLSRGGSNSILNLQPLCLVCNNRKGTRCVDYRDPRRLVQLLEILS
jgi:5-methylcytosine-specific restriction endonuclease McrA